MKTLRQLHLLLCVYMVQGASRRWRFRPLRSLARKEEWNGMTYVVDGPTFRCKQATCRCQYLLTPGKQPGRRMRRTHMLLLACTKELLVAQRGPAQQHDCWLSPTLSACLLRCRALIATHLYALCRGDCAALCCATLCAWYCCRLDKQRQHTLILLLYASIKKAPQKHNTNTR